MNLTTASHAIGRLLCAACDRYVSIGQPVMLGRLTSGQQFYICLSCDAERNRDLKFKRESEVRIAAHCKAASDAAKAADAGDVHFDAMTYEQRVEVIRSMLKAGHSDAAIERITGFVSELYREKQRQKILRFAGAGMNAAAISAETGFGIEMVTQILAQASSAQS